MISAFGVEHGVSKGLGGWFRSARTAQKPAGRRTAGQIGSTPANSTLNTYGRSYVLARDQAKVYGRSAGRSMRSNPNQAAVHQTMGQEAKRSSRRFLSEARGENTLQRRKLP